jgi:hypothetical protein
VFSSGRGLARWLSSDTRASTGRSGSGSRTVGRSNKIARMAWAMMVHGERFKEPSDRLVQILGRIGKFTHDGRLAFHLPARPNEASRGTAERLCRSGSSVTRCYASLNRRSGPATYPAVCSKRATPLDNVHQADRKPQWGGN